MDNFITVTKSGANIATGVASANVAIPTASSGEIPRFIRVSATAACYVKLGTANTVTAAAGDLLVQPADAVILQTAGMSYVAAIQDSAGGKCNIAPLENL